MSIWDKINKDKPKEFITFTIKDVKELREEYNKNLDRMYKAEEYYRNNNLNEKEFNHTFYGKNGYLDIIKNLSFLIQQYSFITGLEMTEEEKINGFY